MSVILCKVALRTLRGVGVPDLVTGDGFTLGETKPTIANTGSRIPREELTVYTGDLIVTTAGATISGLLVKGRILVRAWNVTIEDCIVELVEDSTAVANMIDTSHSGARYTTVRFTEVSAADAPTYWINGIGPKSITVERCYVHDVVDAFSVHDLSGNNDPIILKGNFVDLLFYITPTPGQSDNRTHNDGVQSQGGPSLVHIEGNHIRGYESPNSTGGGSDGGTPGYAYACVMLNTNPTRFASAVYIVANWFDGGGDSINGRGTDGGVITIIRNRFSRNRQYFPITANITLGSTWVIPTSGANVNVWGDTGEPIASTATFTQSSGTQTIRRYF